MVGLPRLALSMQLRLPGLPGLSLSGEFCLSGTMAGVHTL